MSQVLILSLTAIDQTLFTNNKRAISLFLGMVTLITQPGFYLFQVNNRNTKKKLTVRIPERNQ